jgi:pathogenesis-related protein 1
MKSSLIAALIAACGHSGGSKPAQPPAEPAAAGAPVEESDPVEPPAEKPAAATSAPSKPARPAPAKPAGNPIAQAWIDAHNKVRAAHCAPPLTWSKTLASIAQTWADTLKAKGCGFAHSNNQKYGENLAAGTSGALDPESTVAMWYDEKKLYKWPNGGFSMNTGHFTQVVWTTTSQVGCGTVSCEGRDIFVCNYDPPGNWEGQYKEHVLPTSCKK